MKQSFFGRTCGTVTIMTAVMLPLILGVASLSIDYGVWLYQKRQLQMIADTAAIGGIMAIKNGNASQVSSYAISDAALNGFTASAINSITVSNPPISGSYTGDSKAVQVSLKKKVTGYMSAMVLSESPTLHATSVGLSKVSTACVVTLGSGKGVTLNGGASITSPLCGLYVNDTASNSITLNGPSSIAATTVSTAGGIVGDGISVTQYKETYASHVSDPYSNLPMPSAGSCTSNNFSSSGIQTISPGTYCNGMDLKAHANVTMLPGTYIINGGSFNVNGQASLTGTGVTIILTGSSGNYATASISGGATLALSAPTSGTYKSILFFGDRNASGVTHSFNGGSTAIMNGIIYTPASDLTFGGNSSAGGTYCTQLVSNSVTVSGVSYFGSNCTMSQATTVGNISLAE